MEKISHVTYFIQGHLYLIIMMTEEMYSLHVTQWWE